VERAIPGTEPKTRKRKKSNDKAKSFEKEVERGLKLRPRSFTARFTDKMTVGPDGRMIRAKGTQSPPDLIHNSSTMNALIECKLVTVEPGKEHNAAIGFKRLEEHQEDHLRQYSKIGGCHLGYIAVSFYNGQLGKQRLYRAWLLPYAAWRLRRSTIMYRGRARESWPMADMEELFPDREMDWVTSKDGGHWNADEILRKDARC
jgi:hypothetical protein